MNIIDILNLQKNFFNSNKTKDVSFRKENLIKLKNSILKNQKEIYTALKLDLNKSEYEAYLTEVSVVLSEIDVAIKNIKKWCTPIKKSTPISLFPSKSYILNEPYGIALILSPWNYPFQLAIAPLVAAISAGNCAIIKCSKSSKNTTKAICDLINSTFSSKYIYCLEESCSYDDILAQKYDYVFFTGSSRVGKIVMNSCAKNLTPLSLELGGKSPCFVDVTANIDISAKRIAWGKLLNSGQTCVAPDYIIIDNRVKGQFINRLEYHIKNMYPNPIFNDNYPKIINQSAFTRLAKLIDEENEKIGGNYDANILKIEPTIFPNATFESKIMQDEIFGPIIPIIGYDNLQSIINTVKSKEKPLALYIFSEDKKYCNKITSEISYGGGCINDTVVHLANHNIPFGGAGLSGMGNYHGKFGFDTFSHKKSIVKNITIFDIPLRYAQYTELFGEKTQ